MTAPVTEVPSVPTRAAVWARRNLFRSWLDGLVTVVFGTIGLYLAVRGLRFVFVTGRWEVVRRNLTLFMVGRFPPDEQWRIGVAVVVLAGWAGVIAGVVRTRQVRAGRTAVLRGRPRVLDLVRRFALLAVATLLVLSLTSSVGPWAMVAGMVVAAVVGRIVGAPIGVAVARLPSGAVAVAVVLWLAVPVGLTYWLASTASWNDWGGLMLSIFIAVTSIVLCFPLGVLLALGRRSKLPVVRIVCTVYIEVFRGSPLFVLLLLANRALEFFVPADRSPGVVVRAIVVFTLFTAAYLAEIVRGGLQSLPPGQEEAAKALGLRPGRTTVLIVLPQALRNVIPAQIGQFISLFKDTTLAGAAMGLFELLDISEAAATQPGFNGQGLIIETLVFAGFLFWVGCYTMSRESQRLERRLGVGER